MTKTESKPESELSGAIDLEIGCRVKGVNGTVLHCGSGRYEYAIVVNVSPLVLVSSSGDMIWTATTERMQLEDIGPAGWMEWYAAMGRYAIESKWQEQLAALTARLSDAEAERDTALALRDEYIRQCRKALDDAAAASSKGQEWFAAKVNAEAENERLRKRIETLEGLLREAIELHKAADEQRLAEHYEVEAEAAKWKAEGDMYGWNFHQGRASGMTHASIIFHRVQRFLEEKLAATLAAADGK